MILSSTLFACMAAQPYALPKKALRFDSLKPASSTEVIDSKGHVLDYWAYGRFLLYRPLSHFSQELQEFVVFMEDAKFWYHRGFDIAEIKNSIQENIEGGKVKRGASTITQQLAKNLFLDKERSLVRKLFEIPWTYRLEKDLTKRQLLELYLNIIEWGPGIYGAEAAARHFFDREASELTTGQAMYLALIIPNPKRFDVFANSKNLEFLQNKKKWLVERLIDEKKRAPELKPDLLAADFGLVAPDAPGRRFPVRHEGAYAGNLRSRDPSLKLLEERLRPKARGRAQFTVSVDREKMRELSTLPTIEAEVPTQRIFALLEADKVRAFRVVDRKKSLVALACKEFVELPSLDAAKLVP